MTTKALLLDPHDKLKEFADERSCQISWERWDLSSIYDTQSLHNLGPDWANTFPPTLRCE